MSSLEDALKIGEVDNSSNEFKNADLSSRACLRLNEIGYSARRGDIVGKPCYVAGGKMNGAVTSLVKYFPNADFMHHDHPQGEEIFVLEGVFTDERGDHKAGTYLLNPETFEHTPQTSEEGNIILIRLRQYPNIGVRRTEAAIKCFEMEWKVPTFAKRGNGVMEKLMYPVEEDQAEYPERQWVEQWTKESTPEPFEVKDLLEIFVLSGSFTNEKGVTYNKYDWLRIPKGDVWAGKVADGCDSCKFLVKSGIEHVIPPQIVMPDKLPPNDMM